MSKQANEVAVARQRGLDWAKAGKPKVDPQSGRSYNPYLTGTNVAAFNAWEGGYRTGRAKFTTKNSKAY